MVYSLGFSQEEGSVPDNANKTKTESEYKINSQNESSSPQNVNDVPSVGAKDYLTVVFVLVLVIILLYAVLKVIKRVGGSRIGLDNDQIKVLSTKVLKGSTALHLVEVGSQVFLIGATDNSINSISEITDKETLDTIKLESTQEEGLTNSFLGLFNKKLKNTLVNEEATSEAINNVQINREKLDKF